MKSLSTMFLALLGLALLAAMGLGVYFAIIWIARGFPTLSLPFATVTIIASLAMLLAVTSVVSSIHQVGRSHKANTLRAEKAATYKLFTDLWAALLQSGRMPEDGSQYPWVEERQALDHLMALYGSSRVVKAYAVFRALAGESGPINPHLRSQFTETLLEMRKDLGSQTWGLRAAELQQLFFANSEEGSASVKSSGYQDVKPRVSLASSP